MMVSRSFMATALTLTCRSGDLASLRSHDIYGPPSEAGDDADR